MRKDLTEIVVVLDRSGSMESCRADMVGGLNVFVQEQQRADGFANFTLVEFDTEYNFVHTGVDIRKVGKLDMVPRGGTALLDAVGRAINETGARLDKLSDAEKPGLVIFMIITDGEENSSKEFTNAQINKMIIHQQEKYKWEFSFLGADQDSFSVARTLGINSKGVSNYNKANPMNVFRNASIMASSARNSSIVGEAVNYSYTQDMREDNMKGKENKDDTSDLIAKFGQNGQKILDYVDLVNVITP